MMDFIGDVHGHASALEALLVKLGYSKHLGVYRHPTRQAVFVGDYIDRGPHQLATIELVRAMVDAGSAQALLGNHELNAVGYGTEFANEPGAYLRPRSTKNTHQHQAFLDEVAVDTPLYRELLAWFKTLPVYLDTGAVRAVHACWHQRSLEVLAPFLNPDNSIKESAWPALHEAGTEPYRAIETILKGSEVELPVGVTFMDKDGVERSTTRTRWWDKNANTYSASALTSDRVRIQIPTTPLPEDLLYSYDEKRPVLIGHYWATGVPSILTPQIAVLDYSIGKGTADGKLCAYRWDGEQTLLNQNFVWVSGGPA